MDSLAKVFKVKNLDQTHSELYGKILRFRDILYEKSAEIIEEITQPQEIKTIAKKSKIPLFVTGGIGLAALGTVLGIQHSKKSKNDNPNKKA